MGCKWILNFRLFKTQEEKIYNILLHEFFLLLFFNTLEKLIDFLCCWDVEPHCCILCSAVSLSCSSRPVSRTRGSYVVWVANQTARCGFPSAPVTIEITFIKYNITPLAKLRWQKNTSQANSSFVSQTVIAPITFM